MLRGFSLLVAAMLLASSCGSESRTTDINREAGIYAAVIRAVAADAPARPNGDDSDDDQRVVYAGALDEETDIPADVQAAVVERLEGVVTIRFVDERTEAFDSEEESEPVLDDGILVLLGRVPIGRSPSVDVERHSAVDDVVQLDVTIARTSGEWIARIDQPP